MEATEQEGQYQSLVFIGAILHMDPHVHELTCAHMNVHAHRGKASYRIY